MLWQFEELGYDYSIDYNGRTGPKPVRWDYYHDWRRKYLYDFYSSLINLRNAHQEVFQTDDYDVSLNSYRKRIRLRHESMNVIVVGNFGIEEGTLLPGFPHTGTWYDYFTGESFEVTDLEESMILQEGETHLYTDVELTTPEIGTDINENKQATGNSRVFPNPSNGQITLAFELDSREKLDVSLLDLNGRKLSGLIHQQYDKGLHEIHLNLSSTLQPGIYLLDVLTGQAREVHKLVIH